MLKLHLNGQNSLTKINEQKFILLKESILGSERLDIPEGITLEVFDSDTILHPGYH